MLSEGSVVLAVVVAGSSLERSLDPRSLLEADLLIAADRGAEALLEAGRLPDVLVGDMDSLRPSTLQDLRARGVEILPLHAEKDETDLEVALRVATERDATAVTVYGALGGPRLDHLVATLLLLTAPWLADVTVRLVDEWHEVTLVRDDLTIHGSPGETVSLLPLTPRVERVVTQGLRYRLDGDRLQQGTTRGVSNELIGSEARVRHAAGQLLLIHYHGKAEPHVQFEPDGG